MLVWMVGMGWGGEVKGREFNLIENKKKSDKRI
jgi:hypothetical protein